MQYACMSLMIRLVYTLSVFICEFWVFPGHTYQSSQSTPLDITHVTSGEYTHYCVHFRKAGFQVGVDKSRLWFTGIVNPKYFMLCEQHQIVTYSLNYSFLQYKVLSLSLWNSLQRNLIRIER